MGEKFKVLYSTIEIFSSTKHHCALQMTNVQLPGRNRKEPAGPGNVLYLDLGGGFTGAYTGKKQIKKKYSTKIHQDFLILYFKIVIPQ